MPAMPNYCSNTLIISGPTRHVASLLAQVNDPQENTALSLERIAPTPEHLLNPPKRTGQDAQTSVQASMTAILGLTEPTDWHSWRVRTWGTKWDVDAHLDAPLDLSAEHGEATLTFASAWSPPVEALTILAAQHPQCALELSYDEPGNDFSGVATWADGALTGHTTGPSLCNSEYDDEDDADAADVAGDATDPANGDDSAEDVGAQ